ncbi:Membrane-associated phospholipid phosphatase [Glycomyces sambucus]|uniref:Membrane-associated phospholipid phosphatase n=1 Tax=Glycomyces sambucus TaxID=380244 RepID=A0A1G9DD80_9ACTN|nr:phosphatase PAP2 family protein [Glycomyces sambucus]SDK61836.1 Membrane-associated phospholipid phosphatase [Glycomyces sambucus]
MTPNGFPKSRTALALAVLVPLAVVGDALWIRLAPGAPPWQALDDSWNGLVGGPADGVRWQLAQLLNRLGGDPGLALLAIAVVALLIVRRWRSAVFALAAVAASALVVDLAKRVGERPRPLDVMVETGSWAFPSGHAARMAAFVVIVAVVWIPARHLRTWWPVAVFLTVLMMGARTWQHAHWLTDTVGGAAIGWAVAALVWFACTPLLDRERELREALDAPPVAESAAGEDALR